MRVIKALGLLLLTAAPLTAQNNDVGVWIGRSRVGTTTTSGTDVRFDQGDSFGASLNHFFGPHLSAEVAVFSLRHDGSLDIGGEHVFDIGRLRMTPLTGTLQYHVASGRLDPYIGGGLAYVKTSSLHSADLDTAGIGSVRVKSRVGGTAVLGVSYMVRPPFGIGADVRYIGYHPSSGPADNSVKLELSPIIYSVGLRWRF